MGVTGRIYLPLFRHQSGNTLIHRIPAAVKLAFLMALTVLVFSGNPYLLAGSSFFILIAAIVARLSPASLFRLFRIIVFYGLFIVAVRLIGKNRSLWQHELTESLWYLWKLSAVFTAGMVFFETTTGVAVHQLLSSVRKALSRIFPFYIPDFPRSFSLMLLFIPRIFETWTTLSRAWDARGGNLKRGPIAGIRKLTTLIPLLIISLLDVAATTDKAVRNRG